MALARQPRTQAASAPKRQNPARRKHTGKSNQPVGIKGAPTAVRMASGTEQARDTAVTGSASSVEEQVTGQVAQTVQSGPSDDSKKPGRKEDKEKSQEENGTAEGKAGRTGPEKHPGDDRGVKTEGEFGAELDIKRPPLENSDADGKQRLESVLNKVEQNKTAQQGPAANRSKQTKAAQGASAEAAAASPIAAGETESAGQIGKIDSMDQEKAGKVDKTSFKALVKKKLAELKTPASPEEMEEFGEKGGASGLRAGVVGDVKKQSDGAQAGIRGATEKPAQPGQARKITPLPDPGKPPALRNVHSARVLPPPKSEREVSLQPESNAVDARMQKEKLSDERLAKANDPRFSSLSKAKSEVHENAKEAPAQFGRQEQALLNNDKKSVNAQESALGKGMLGANTLARSRVAQQQKNAMTADQAARAKVAKDINAIFTSVEAEVKKKLLWLTGEVDRQFDAGEKKARTDFENHVARELRSWKLRRYGSRALIPVVGVLVAAGTWVYDKARGITHFPEVQKIFEDGRKRYLDGLEAVIEGIASTVDNTLAWCKTEIGRGKKQVQVYVKGLDDSLKDAAKKTTAEVFAKFDSLGDEVEAKKEELADHLVQRYKESRQAIENRIKEMKAANSGLINRFIGKLKAVLEALRNFRNKLLSLMSQASAVIAQILEDPIGFLGNLLKALKAGFQKFSKNFVTHLKSGIFGWLFGAFAGMGINIPTEFSLKSIAGFILEVLGVTWERIRPKIVRVVGERNVALLEKVFGYVKTLFTEGPKGLWNEIKDDLSSLKDTVFSAIKEWLVTKIITAAVTKLVSMFNPVGAIVQAILAIYNVIMFFVERINQILQLVKSIIGSLGKIVRGQIEQAAAFVEKTMAMALPLVIAFLARLLGLGGVAEKVKAVIGKVRNKVDRAIDKAIKRIAKRLKKLFGRNGKKKTGEANSAQNKQRAISEVKEALKKGIRRSKLKKLLARLKKKYDLKMAYLDKGDDAHIVNSPDTEIKAAPPNPKSKQTEHEDIKVSDPAGKKQRRKKGPGEAKLIGKFSSQALEMATPAKPIKAAFEGFEYPNMPDDAPRPVSAKADLYGRVKGISRSSDTTKQGLAGKFGEIEARLLGKETNYDGGHLIANEFGGPDEYRNFVPMKRSINQQGVYKRMEDWTRNQLRELPPNEVSELPINLTMVVQPIYRNAISIRASIAGERLGKHARKRVHQSHGFAKSRNVSAINKLEKKQSEVGTLSTEEQQKLSNARRNLSQLQAQSHEDVDRELARPAQTRASTRNADATVGSIDFPSRIPKQIKVSVTFEADSEDIANAQSRAYAERVQPDAGKRKSADGETTIAMGNRGKKGNVTTSDPILIPESDAATGAQPQGTDTTQISPGVSPPMGKKKFRKDFSITE